jgi:hypothetical protein
MKTQRIAGGHVNLDGGSDLLEEEDTEYLLAALKELVDRLSGHDPHAAGAASEAVESWESDDFLYVETALARSAGAEIDVSIQGGRAFIRMAR